MNATAYMRRRLSLLWAMALVVSIISGPLLSTGLVFADPSTSNIALTKFVSVDGGVNWLDSTRPGIDVGSPVWMRVSITNTGGTSLTNFSLTDETLSTDGVDYQTPLNAAIGTPACPTPLPSFDAGTSLIPTAT